MRRSHSSRLPRKPSSQAVLKLSRSPETLGIVLQGNRGFTPLCRHERTESRLQGYRRAVLKDCRIALGERWYTSQATTPHPWWGIPLRAKASSVIERCEKNFLLKSRERPSVGFPGVQARRISGECQTYRDQNRVTEKSLSHNCTAFSAL
jgi:hypothetical protein